MKIVDLKDSPEFLEQYIEMRNSYADLLLTQPVGMEQTRLWLKKQDIEVRGLAERDLLLGVVILYLDKDNEIAFFARETNKGMGGLLLDVVEAIAREKELGSCWSWVWKENVPAQKAFEKKGYVRGEGEIRQFQNSPRPGFKYTMTFRSAKKASQ